MKRGTPNHPKVLQLAELLGIRRPLAIGHLELLFHFTSQYAPQGNVGKFDDKRIAAGLDWHGPPKKLIDALVATRWLCHHPVARLVVHGWSDHADRSVLQRLSRDSKKVFQCNHEDTENLCDQSETNNRTCLASALPVPITQECGEVSEKSGGHDVAPSGVRWGRGASGDDFDPFFEACRFVELPFSEADLSVAKIEWRRLDIEQKLAATQGLRKRKECGEYDDSTYRPLPQNYLSKRMWNRPIRDRNGQQRKRVEVDDPYTDISQVIR